MFIVTDIFLVVREKRLPGEPSIDWNALVCTTADKPVAEAF